MGFTGLRGVLGRCDFFIKLCGYGRCSRIISKAIDFCVNGCENIARAGASRFGNPVGGDRGKETP
jgi:hypothetical protein